MMDTAQLDALVAEIALEHFGIPTLETRKSDSLDFYNVSVWSVRDALAAAFHAGQRAGGKPPR